MCGFAGMVQVNNVRSEHALLSTCNHPFLLKLAGAFQDTESLYMVLEFIQGGEVTVRAMNADFSMTTLPPRLARLLAAVAVVAVGISTVVQRPFGA